MLAGLADVVARQHVVDEQAQARDRRIEAGRLLLGVLADQRRDHDARLVQHDMAEADAFAEADAGRPRSDASGRAKCRAAPVPRVRRPRSSRRAPWRSSGAPRPPRRNRCDAPCSGRPARRECGRRAGSARRGRTSRFLRPSPAGSGRPGWRLGVGQVERPRLRGDRADEALADAQRGVVDRLALQAFGGIEFEHAVRAQHIGRADLGHHVGRDLPHDLVEPVLRADRLRHDLAQAAEQDARPGGRTPHDPLSLHHPEKVPSTPRA